MANILILAYRLPYPFHFGDTLRVFHLSYALSRLHDCFLVVAHQGDGEIPSRLTTDVFNDVFFLPVQKRRSSWRRHFRLSEGSYVRLSNPKYYHNVMNYLEKLVDDKQIDIGIACNRATSVFLRPIDGIKKVVDACDCTTLGQQRICDWQGSEPFTLERLRKGFYLERVRRHENRLSMDFDLVTTVSPADQTVLKKISRINPDRIALLPNGVAPELLLNDQTEVEEENRGIIFWGNMDFAPNFTAVCHFYHDVYRPYLKDQEVTWTIVGANPPAEIKEMGQTEENINVTGFVDDLFGLAIRIPIMINPMVIGSGLKNKVLEAFALKRLVVSSYLGIEGIAGAHDQKHFILAENPEALSRAIIFYLNHPEERKVIGERARQFVKERYAWENIGQQYLKLINSLLT
jgi:glycosyltransferase involved in cell wall biosynthesis